MKAGKPFVFGAGAMMTRKSINGGESFHHTTFQFSLLVADVRGSILKIDNLGNILWLSKGRIKHNPDYDYDIFYGNNKP